MKKSVIMTTKRKLSNTALDNIKTDSLTIKGESNNAGSMGGADYMMAKGRLQGVLKLLTERSDSDNSSSHDGDIHTDGYTRKQKRQRQQRQPQLTQQPNMSGQYRHTYVMKLFDRSVDLAKFEEDTPLYPICRAWMANQPRNQTIKHNPVQSSKTSGSNQLWVGGSSGDVWRLPPPAALSANTTRAPSPTIEQRTTNVANLADIVEGQGAMTKEELIRAHLKRWVGVKRKWTHTAALHEERFAHSKQILQAIYNKAQDTLLE